MFQTKSQKWRSCIAVLLVLSMMLSIMPAAFATDTTTLNYVSLGDSMANGYGFVGYNQTNKPTDDYDFMAGEGVYGTGAYPDQFADYLTREGYNVNHTKLAVSAMLAEDLLYLLGGREEFNDGWAGYKHYVGYYGNQDEDAILMPYFQQAVTNADIITMGIGNAAFGAFMLNKVTDALGIFGAELDADEKVYFEDAIRVLELDAEQYDLVMQVYNELELRLVEMVPAELVEQYSLNDVVDILAYTTASYIVNYKLLIERILEMNPDVEIILVGLLNTTYGMNVTDESGNVILPFGDVMDRLFDVLNTYMAGLPVVLQAQGVAEEAKLYYAEQPNPLFICQQFKALQDVGWGNIQDGRLSGATVRERNITAYNENLAGIIGMAVTGKALHGITLTDVENYEGLNWSDYSNPWLAFGETQDNIDKLLSVAVYLAIEEAVAKSTDTMNIPLSGLMKIASNDLSSVFTALGTPPEDSPESSRKWLVEGLSTPETQGMCKIYGLFKVGNGMSVHPTPEGHDNIADSVIAAYENQYTARDHIKDTLIEAANTLKELAIAHGPEALLMLEQYMINEGWMTAEELAMLKDKINQTIYAVEMQDTELLKQLCAELVQYIYNSAVAHGIIDDEQAQTVLGWIVDVYSYFSTTTPDQIKTDAINLLTKFWNEHIAQYINPDDTLIQQFTSDLRALLDLIENTSIEDMEQAVNNFIAGLEAKYAQLIDDATHGEYTPDANSYYVALGGYTAAGFPITNPDMPYWGLVSGEDGLNVNAATLGNKEVPILPSQILDYVNSNASEIKRADLITYQMDASSFVFAALNETPDWSRYLTAEEIAYLREMQPVVEEILYTDWTTYADIDTAAITAQIKEKVLAALPADVTIGAQEMQLAEDSINSILTLCVTQARTAAQIAQNEKTNLLNQFNALDDETVQMVSDMAENLVYACVAYSVDTVKALETIQAINPNATVLLVGMYNPLQGLNVKVNGTLVDIGEMMEYVIDVTNLYHMAYAVIDGNVTFVDVSDAEINGFADTIIDVDSLNARNLANTLMNMTNDMHANAAGHRYIYEQIMGALVPEETGLLGDVDLDSDVDTTDWIILRQYLLGNVELTDAQKDVADVDRNGAVNTTDWIILRQHLLGNVNLHS